MENRQYCRHLSGEGYLGCCERLCGCISIAIILLLFSISLFGCKAQSVVATQPSTTILSSEQHIELIHDTIYRDRYHTIEKKGDTVYIHDSVTIDRWRLETKGDTIRIERTDTIYQEPVIIKEPAPKQSTFLRNSGIALWIIISLILLSIIIGLIIKFAK